MGVVADGGHIGEQLAAAVLGLLGLAAAGAGVERAAVGEGAVFVFAALRLDLGNGPGVAKGGDGLAIGVAAHGAGDGLNAVAGAGGLLGDRAAVVLVLAGGGDLFGAGVAADPAGVGLYAALHAGGLLGDLALVVVVPLVLGELGKAQILDRAVLIAQIGVGQIQDLGQKGVEQILEIGPVVAVAGEAGEVQLGVFGVGAGIDLRGALAGAGIVQVGLKGGLDVGADDQRAVENVVEDAQLYLVVVGVEEDAVVDAVAQALADHIAVVVRVIVALLGERNERVVGLLGRGGAGGQHKHTQQQAHAQQNCKNSFCHGVFFLS